MVDELKAIESVGDSILPDCELRRFADAFSKRGSSNQLFGITARTGTTSSANELEFPSPLPDLLLPRFNKTRVKKPV